MRNPAYSTIDKETGNYHWDGPLSLEKGDHRNMPPRTPVYLPGDERGHLTASSLGGTNSRMNITAQAYDVNHHGFIGMEAGERAALASGASVDSHKTAIVNGEIGGRPDVYMANDNVTYDDGHTEAVHLLYTNLSYADQQAMNDFSAAQPDTFLAPNPGDGLRDSMTTAEYAELMESTDALLVGIEEDYAPSDAWGAPAADAADLSADLSDDDGISCSMDDD